MRYVITIVLCLIIFLRDHFLYSTLTQKTQYRIVYGFPFARGDTHSKGEQNTTTKVQRNLKSSLNIVCTINYSFNFKTF